MNVNNNNDKVWILHHGYKFFGLSNQPKGATCFRNKNDAYRELERAYNCGVGGFEVTQGPCPKDCDKVWESGEMQALMRKKMSK